MQQPYRLDRLHIEVTNICNFKCEFCPDAIMERQRGHMEFSLLAQILAEVAQANLARILTFHLMGEPFIYPPIFDAIALAVEQQLTLHLTTNGSIFALKPDYIERLVQSPVAKVTISLQTPDPVTFTIRGAPPRLQPEDYFNGITRYVQAHLRQVQQQSSPTRVHIKFLDTTPHPFLVPHKPLTINAGKAQMQTELQNWAERLLAGCGMKLNRDRIQQQIRQYKPGRWQLIQLHPQLALEVFPLDSWGNVETEEVVPASFGYCNGASQQAGILYDGTVVPCCKDYEGMIPLGSVTEQSLAQILTAQLACRLRQDFDQLKVSHPVCQRCMGADSHRKAVLRQLGSIAYFKAYSPLMKRLQPGWGEV
jgi:MoaA/NifB/PqqE/SkfB family radical SAM enzyme